MARLDGLRRAAFFDDASYSQSTLETQAQRCRRYQHAEQAAGLEACTGTTEWTIDYFVQEATRSIAAARKQLPAVAHYFRIHNRGDAFPYDEIAELLRETSVQANDPLGAPLSALRVPWHQRLRARAFADKMNPVVRATYARCSQGWEVYARRYAIDCKHAAVPQFVGYLSAFARTHRYRTVSNLCSALSHYFRAAAVQDLTRHQKVREFLAVVAREDARTSQYRPLYAEDLRVMVSPFGPSLLDVRDRNILLVNHFGTLFAAELRKLAATITPRDDGVVVYFEGNPIFIGGVEDPELDVRIWLPRWRQILPPGPGPLFPAMTARGDWTQVPLAAVTLCNIVKHAAQRANITAPHPTLALRKGFAIRATRVVGPVQTAKHMRLKSTSSLEAHVRLDRQDRSRSARAGAKNRG